ncbi:altronate dehydratase [Vibrio sp. S11_S32]|uniref:UxaA family hydrolase n=1 Tax=Vibrio sp. S11_S32 TaxID=2720225 RepID=UPI0016804C0C|nr:altronate dehydratase family protein [Vibrio sp. S11_S32]MBD1577522.1 altronate dehydratase [Vibrio sp. S11_S32]
MSQLLHIHPKDTVAVALTDLEQNVEMNVNGLTFKTQETVTQGHKVALKNIKTGDHIFKYGAPIGHALNDIKQGMVVNQHNIKTNLNKITEYSYQAKHQTVSSSLSNRAINIFRRANGQIGIRNELWIIPTVGCVNAIGSMMKKQFLQHNDCEKIDGIHVFNHQFGCSQLGDDHNNTRLLLQNLALHPNAGGVLVLGLGCENNQIKAFKETLGEFDENRIKFMVCQEHDDEIDTGLSILNDLYHQMENDQRSIGHIHELNFGLECGGSDGLSGITANPLLGQFSDYVISHGGTSVLTEVPEMFGAEHLLMQRCQNQLIFDKTVEMINAFKQYFIDHDQPIYENPSPGNKAGGISTLEEKSLGCTQKSGQSAVIEVLHYGERIHKRGLHLLSAPGNDAIATSALTISHCHMVLFSTGRGTPYGGPVPTLKIATNSSLAKRKPHWIDFNAGQLVENKPMDILLNEFIDLVVSVVNGKQARNEINDFKEIAVFKTGVTL